MYGWDIDQAGHLPQTKKGVVMRYLIMVSVAGLVLGFGASSFATESDSMGELYAVSQLAGQTPLKVMSDQQLTSVEGMSFKRHHDCGCKGHGSRSVRIEQSNWMEQANVNFGGRRSGTVEQFNGATQSNFALVR
jgi:hypothetical protein